MPELKAIGRIIHDPPHVATGFSLSPGGRIMPPAESRFALVILPSDPLLTANRTGKGAPSRTPRSVANS
jgi:hypothetical protein